MNRNSPRSKHRPTGVQGATATLLLAVALVSASHAESTLLTAASSGRTLQASGHLDFRVTVLPVMALSAQASGLRIQGNGGVLTVQRDGAGGWDGRAPESSTQLRPQGRVVDAAMQVSAFGRGDLITIASP
jgi:hypothetical protein